MQNSVSRAEAVAASELGAQAPVRHYVAQEQSFPLNHLSERQFEVLAYLLLDAESRGNDAHDSALLLPIGADEGRDVVLYKKNLPVGVVQCKRFADAIGIGLVLPELFKFLLFALRDPSMIPQARNFRYEFWTARNLTKDAGKFFKEPEAYFKEHESELGGYVKAARKACKSLQEQSERGTTFEEEERQVIAIARELAFHHVGPLEVSLRLRGQAEVRKWFFRGPEDVPHTACVPELGELVNALMHQTIERLTHAGNLASGTYVPSTALARDFDEFLASGERLFVLAGGSGHGKTTWAANVLAAPPPGWSVLFIKGEDLSANDVNIAGTLARLLKANALPEELTEIDMTAAVWRWLDAANRLLLVDGLDRVPSQAREAIPAWIENTLAASAACPSRLLLVTRNEEWRRIRDAMSIEVAPPRHLGLLSDEEAQHVYRAYGLAPIHHQRPLRTPSLIRRLSRLKGKPGGVVTRARLLESSVGQRKDALALKLGKLQVERALAELSRALGASPDVRVRTKDFASDVTLTILDEFNRQDILVDEPPWLRPESDDVAEYLIALELDVQQALAMVEAGRTDPVFCGAIAIAPQLSGREAELPPLLAAVLPRIQEAMGTWFELAARIMIEVEDHSRHLPVLRRIFDAWEWTNLALYASNLHELMDDLRLPLAERFDLLMRIADQEDEDDWREKFWLDPDMPGRTVTPFATTMCDLVRSHAVESLPLLENLCMQSGGGIRRAIASALLYEAAAAALPETLTCCMRLGDFGREMTTSLATLYPLGFARHALGRARASAAAIDEVVDDFCRAFLRAVGDGPASARGDEWAALIADMLSLGASGRARQRFLLCALTLKPDRQHLHELFGALDKLHWSDLWWLVRVAGAEADVPLRAIFSGTVDKHVPYGCLAQFKPGAVPPEHWQLVASLLEQLIISPDERARRAASEALEIILRKLEREEGGSYRMFMAAARELAADSEGHVRAPLLYYGAGVRRGWLAPEAKAFRRELVSVLARAEDGTTLDALRKKLYEDSPTDRFNASILSELNRRFGAPPPERQELYDLLAQMRRRYRAD